MDSKYFIAIVPPEPLLSQIQSLKQSVHKNYGSKGALRSPAHITLHMPFSWGDHKEQKLIDCLSAFKYSQSFMISLADFSCFEPRVIFIDVKQEEHLSELQKNMVRHVKTNLQLFNQSDDMRGFHPHITIAFRDLKKQMFYNIWQEYKDKQFSESFMCRSFSLLKQTATGWEVYKTFEFGT